MKFLARTPDYQVLLTPAEAVLALRGRGATQPATVRMQLVGEGVNRAPVVEALDALPAHSNYYLGNDPQRWRAAVPHFAKVRYEQVYPGVDWVLYGNPRQLEYDFVVAPGADPNAINVRFAGADAMRVEANGELVVSSAGRTVLHSSPTLYQVVNGERQIVDGRYVLRESADAAPVVGFEIAAYDPKLPLVIDPVIYFTFMDCYETVAAPPDPCSSGDDFGWDITVDSLGNAYITGSTASENYLVAIFPLKVVVNAANITVNSAPPGIAACTNNTGDCDEIYPADTLVTLTATTTIATPTWTWTGCTSSGGPVCLVRMDKVVLVTVTATAGDQAQSDSAQNPDAMLDYQPADDASFNGATDAFVTRLNSSGGIVYTTYLGGASDDYGYGIALDNQGNFYVTGATRSIDFPRLTPFQNVLGGTQDAFVTKFDITTGQLSYSTYLGGAGVDSGRAIIVNSQGQAYVTGYTNSANFPVLNGAPGGGGQPFDPTYNNGDDVFVSQINAAGNALVYSTYIGGTGDERGSGIVLDAAGNAYITGYTDSPDFPNAGGLTSCATRLVNPNNYEEVFVTRLNATGNALGYSTCFGGSRYDRGQGIDIDASNNVYITGYTDSPNVAGAINPYSVDGRGFDLDAFLARLDQDGTPVVNAQNQPAYFTYLGGNANDVGYDIAVDCCGSMGTYITGYTVSPDFPLLRADDGVWAGGTEAFITRLDSATGILTYSSFWGGSGSDYGMGIALDAALDVYVTGYANGNKDFPVGPGDPRYRPSAHFVGGYDAFVVKVAVPASNSFTVSVTGGGTGSGAITSSPAGIACIVPDPVTNPGGLNLGDCYEGYVSGTEVTLTATPDTGSTFAGWSGDCKLLTPCVLVVDANKQVAATFNKSTASTTFALAVTLVGSGKVTSNPTGINCGADCTENYVSGTEVTLTATASQGFFFAGWSGACTGTGTCKVVMNQNTNVTATFTAVESYVLTVTKAGAGGGTVTSTPNGINCGSDCSEAYKVDTEVTLVAEANANSTFAGWGGACTGATGACVIAITAAKNVTATFNPVTSTLPDLVVPTLISPATGQQNVGRTISFALEVKNQGNTAAGAFKVGLYLSKDQVIDPATDIKVDNECLFSGLGRDETRACSGTFNPPEGLAGVYYVGAYADPYNAVNEVTKTNNGKATTNPITIGFLAGLTANGQIYYTINLSTWTQISGQLSQLQVGDLNHDGQNDLVGLTTSGEIYYTTNFSTWTQIPGALSRIVVGDFDGDGQADDLAGVASNGSIWYTTNLSTWTRIPGALDRIVVGDFDGDGRADLAGVASNGSIWYTTNLSTWTRIPGALSRLVVGDFDGDGKADDLAGVASNGSVWYTIDLSTWKQISGALNRLVAGDFNGDGKANDLAGIAGDGSIWYTTNLSTWTRIPGALSQMVVGNFGGDGRTDLAGLAGDGGIWYTTNLSAWTQIPGQLSRLAGDD
ncbi:MAG: SBBP repeat-containing protein [Candidatus Contendobacter sp.]